MQKINMQGQALGTFHNICIYEMRGKTYYRKKSSLTRKRVLKDKEFEKTRKYAGSLAMASRIGSYVYKALPCEIRERWIYRAITGEAASLLYEGKEEQEVKQLLWKKYIENTGVEKEAKKAVSAGKGTSRNNPVHSSRSSNLQLWNLFRRQWEKQGKPYYFFKRAWQKRGYFNRERFREILEIMQLPWYREKVRY